MLSHSKHDRTIPLRRRRARANPLAAIASTASLLLVLAACAMALQMQFSASLTPEAEVPAPTLDGATPSGSASATLNAAENTLTVEGTFSGLTGPATAAHIHGPAEPGEPAGVIFPLTIDSATSGSFSGTWEDMSEEQVAELRSGLYYINIHTDMNPPGEIRGQLE